MNKKFSLVLVWHPTALASRIPRITFGCKSINFGLASVGHVYQVWSRIFFHIIIIIIVRFHFDFALSVQNGSRGFGGQDLNWCKYERILLLIIENESKSHTQMLVTLMQHGVEIYTGSGKSLGIERKMAILLEAVIACPTRRNLRRFIKKLNQILNGESNIER